MYKYHIVQIVKPHKARTSFRLHTELSKRWVTIMLGQYHALHMFTINMPVKICEKLKTNFFPPLWDLVREVKSCNIIC